MWRKALLKFIFWAGVSVKRTSPITRSEGSFCAEVLSFTSHINMTLAILCRRRHKVAIIAELNLKFSSRFLRHRDACGMEVSVKRTSNHSERRLFREEVLSFTREICVCAHLTQTRDAQRACAEMRVSVKFHVLTLFSEMIEQGLGTSVIGKAMQRGAISLNVVNIRDYTEEKHGKVDDYPYGGGAGMLMQAQPVYDACMAVTGGKKIRTVYMTPQGKPFTQKMAEEFSREEELLLLCGHYEGIDERVLEEVVTDRVSIGDYVLTGGELPAMVMIDAIARLVPGVFGTETSAEEESFYNDLLEYPPVFQTGGLA